MFGKNVMGNTFASNTFNTGKGQRVWREIRHRFPGGGTISNLSDWTAKGVIPAGTPCTFDNKTYSIKALTDAQAKAQDVVISGLTQEDIVLVDGIVKGTATVVYAGEIYEYMLDATVVAAIKDKVPAEIHFVN